MSTGKGVLCPRRLSSSRSLLRPSDLGELSDYSSRSDLQRALQLTLASFRSHFVTHRDAFFKLISISDDLVSMRLFIRSTFNLGVSHKTPSPLLLTFQLPFSHHHHHHNNYNNNRTPIRRLHSSYSTSWHHQAWTRTMSSCTTVFNTLLGMERYARSYVLVLRKH